MGLQFSKRVVGQKLRLQLLQQVSNSGYKTDFQKRSARSSSYLPEHLVFWSNCPTFISLLFKTFPIHVSWIKRTSIKSGRRGPLDGQIRSFPITVHKQHIDSSSSSFPLHPSKTRFLKQRSSQRTGTYFPLHTYTRAVTADRQTACHTSRTLNSC